MATTRNTKSAALPGAAIMSDLLYASLGVAALAKDEAGSAIDRLGKKSTKVTRTVTRRLGEVSEELGETLGENLPEAVSEPLHRLRDRIEETYQKSSKRTLKALESTSRKLTSRGKQSWKVLEKRIASLTGLVETGLVPLLRGLGLATRRDLERIDARLDDLDAKLVRIEKRR